MTPELTADDATVEALVEELHDLREQVEEQAERIEELEEQVDQPTSTVAEELTDVNGDRVTPIEEAHVRGFEEMSLDAGETRRRALAIYEHFPEWGKRTPKGWVIKTGDDNLRRLLKAACDGDDRPKHWNQVYRACEELATLSRGKVGYKRGDDGDDKMLVVRNPNLLKYHPDRLDYDLHAVLGGTNGSA